MREKRRLIIDVLSHTQHVHYISNSICNNFWHHCLSFFFIFTLFSVNFVFRTPRNGATVVAAQPTHVNIHSHHYTRVNNNMWYVGWLVH